MPSPLLPFDATVATPDGQPYALRLSQGFNEALYYGSGQPPSPALAQWIEHLMATVWQGARPADDREAFISRLMALSVHIEWLVTALTGDLTLISDHQAFLQSFKHLAGEVAHLDQAQGDLPDWVRARLQDAQFRHFSRFGNPTAPASPPVIPLQRPQPSVWTSQPHWVEPVIATDVNAQMQA